MTTRTFLRSLACSLVFLGCAAPVTAAVVIDFEDLTPGEDVTFQYFLSDGVTFGGATVLTDGDAFFGLFPGFPARPGGINVVYNSGGAITIDFSNPIRSFGGYFTYTSTLTMSAFDGAFLTSVDSAFGSNVDGSGDPGSAPNEFLEVVFGFGITRVVIENALGFPDSFTLDDATIASLGPVPEPPTITLVIVGATTLGVRRRYANPRHRSNRA